MTEEEITILLKMALGYKLDNAEAEEARNAAFDMLHQAGI
jgi:hypothetical protein